MDGIKIDISTDDTTYKEAYKGLSSYDTTTYELVD